jgi:hypothetical protein
MKTQTRRRFLISLGVALGVASLGLNGCSSIEPQPFSIGGVVKAPKGCQELLAKDKRGDC